MLLVSQVENLIENLEDTTRGSIARKPHLPPVNLPHGDYHLLVIGINNYENKYSYTNLPNAERDAADLAEELEKRYKFKQIKKLSNKEATREAILKSLESFESVKTRDNVIIFFAGHGYRQQPLGYIIPYDAEARTKSGFIPYSTIVEHFHLIPAKHILLIVDCCYGGSLMMQRGSETIDMDVQGLEKSVSRKFISSGHEDERVPDGLVGGNSPFMQLLLNTLKENEEEQLPIHALYSQIIKQIEADKLQIPTPRCSPLTQVGDQNGDMVLRLENAENEEAKAANNAIKFRTQTSFKAYFVHEKGENEQKVLDIMEIEQEIQKDIWNKAKEEASFEAINSYLENFKDGFYFLEAKALLAKLKDKSEILYANAESSIESAEKIFGEGELNFGEKLDDAILGKYQDAIKDLGKAITLNPQFLKYYYLRIRVNKILQNHQAMLDDYNKIVEIDIRVAIKSHDYGERALLKAKMGRTNEALADMDKVIDEESDKSMHYIDRGAINQQIGDYDSAIKDYEMAAELSPINAFVPREMIKNVEQRLLDKKNTQ